MAFFDDKTEEEELFGKARLPQKSAFDRQTGLEIPPLGAYPLATNYGGQFGQPSTGGNQIQNFGETFGKSPIPNALTETQESKAAKANSMQPSYGSMAQRTLDEMSQVGVPKADGAPPWLSLVRGAEEGQYQQKLQADRDRIKNEFRPAAQPGIPQASGVIPKSMPGLTNGLSDIDRLMIAKTSGVTQSQIDEKRKQLSGAQSTEDARKIMGELQSMQQRYNEAEKMTRDARQQTHIKEAASLNAGREIVKSLIAQGIDENEIKLAYGEKKARAAKEQELKDKGFTPEEILKKIGTAPRTIQESFSIISAFQKKAQMDRIEGGRNERIQNRLVDRAKKSPQAAEVLDISDQFSEIIPQTGQSKLSYLSKKEQERVKNNIDAASQGRIQGYDIKNLQRLLKKANGNAAIAVEKDKYDQIVEKREKDIERINVLNKQNEDRAATDAVDANKDIYNALVDKQKREGEKKIPQEDIDEAFRVWRDSYIKVYGNKAENIDDIEKSLEPYSEQEQQAIMEFRENNPNMSTEQVIENMQKNGYL